MFEGCQQVVLKKGRHGLIPKSREVLLVECPKDLTYLEADTSTLIGFDKLARCSFATFVDIVAEKR